MKILKNSISYWLIKGKDCKDGEDIVGWWALTSLNKFEDANKSKVSL